MRTDNSTFTKPSCEQSLKKQLAQSDYYMTISEVFFAYLNTKHFRKQCKESRRRILRHIQYCIYHL